MNKIISKHYQYIENKIYYVMPIAFIVLIVPLIVYLKVVPLTGANFDNWKGYSNNYDFFSYHKMNWMLIATLTTLIMLTVKWFNYGFSYYKTKIFMPIIIYFLCIFFSTINSQFKEIAFLGFADRHEGMYVLLAYILIMILVINIIENENQLKFLFGSLFISASIICLIGITQYLDYDIFKSDILKSFIIPNKYSEIRSSLIFNYEPHTMYGTLYHKDYMGSYMAMIFPLSFTMFILIRKKFFKLLMIPLTILMFIGWFGCNSRAAFVGGIFGVFILLIMIRKHLIYKWKYLFLALILSICSIFVLNIASNGRVLSKVNKIFTETVSLFTNSNIDKEKRKNDNLTLQDIKNDKNKLSIITINETLNIELHEGNALIFKDTNNKIIKDIIKNNTITLQNEKYEKYKIYVEKFDAYLKLKIQKDNFILNFAMINNEFKMIDTKGKMFDIKNVRKIGFEGLETLASSRGYIWSRTLPLIMDKPLLGHGPDTFAAYFPQYDIIGKYNNYEGRMWEIIDKPHNLYLQIAFSTGIPSLIAFLVFIGMYCISSVKVYFNNKYTDISSIIGVGIFVAIVSYLITGMLNDSVVSVAPVFWVLLGIGININIKLKSS